MPDPNKALEALQKLAEALAPHGINALGDFIYDIREREGEGWDGPKVDAWGKGCELARQALEG